MFKYLVRLLLQGKALSIEDMVDALSLKDNDYRVEDYTTALHLLARAEVSDNIFRVQHCAKVILLQNIPSARRLSAFKNVWRRIFIHDE